MDEIVTLLPTFALSLGLTLLLEGVVALLFRLRGREILWFFLVNLLTNPAVVYLNLLFSTLFPDGTPFLWQIPLEIGVFALEGVLYRVGASLRRSWLFSLVANALSYGLGLLLNFIL